MKWTIKKVNLCDLKESPNNPRIMTKRQEGDLHESISRFGICEPLVVNQDMVIIGGHQRSRVIRNMGIEVCEVYYPDRMLTEEEAQELLLRLNKNTGEFDYSALANDFEIDDLIEFGFSEKELGIALEIPESFEEDEEEKPSKAVSMIINFKSPEDLQMAEIELAPIIESFPGANYKIKV